jgi:hypothetical protein
VSSTSRVAVRGSAVEASLADHALQLFDLTFELRDMFEREPTHGYGLKRADVTYAVPNIAILRRLACVSESLAAIAAAA